MSAFRPIPKLISIAQFQSVGFYDFYKAKACVFKGARKNIQLTGSLPPTPTTPQVLVGLFYHDMMESIGAASTVLDFSKTVENLILNYAERARKVPALKRAGNFANWPEVNFASRKAIDAFKRKKLPSSDLRQSEKMLVSSCGSFVGKPDLVLVQERTAQLIEFKSNDIRNEKGDLKPEYHEQLLFYSFLLFQNYALDRIEASIESMSNDRIDFEISSVDSSDYYVSARSWLADVNSLVTAFGANPNLDSISSPSENNCWSCEKRLLCQPFKAHQTAMQINDNVFVVEGKVIAKDTKAPNLDTVVVDDFNLNRDIRVKCEKLLSNQIHMNSSYTFTNLKRTTLGFETTSTTEVFVE